MATAPQVVQFKQSYNGFDPATIFQVDDATKTLKPFSSGDAYTGAGYTFGQQRIAAPTDFNGYSVGQAISKAPVTSPLDGVKTDLNNLQTNLFADSPQNSNQRQSSQLSDQIAQTLADQKAEEDQFNALRDKYNNLDSLNLTDYFNTLRQQQGVPQTESDLLATRDAERNLEGGLRTASGNAGPTTEALFQADLAERQKPLTLKETALNDRLSLANDYITKALNLKETDVNAARSALEKGISLVQDSITASSNRISTLSTLRSAINTQVQQGEDSAKATLNTLIQSGALDKLSNSDLSMLEHNAGMPLGSLAAVRDSIKPKSNIIGTETDDSGNIGVITQNTDGSFSAHMIPGIKGKTAASSAAATGVTPDATATVQALAQQNPSTWTQDQWAQRRAQYVQDFGEKAAENLYDQNIPKPSASANQPNKGNIITNAWNGIVNFFKGL